MGGGGAGQGGGRIARQHHDVWHSAKVEGGAGASKRKRGGLCKDAAAALYDGASACKIEAKLRFKYATAVIVLELNV